MQPGGPDERSPLLPDPDFASKSDQSIPSKKSNLTRSAVFVWATFLGEFLASVDESLMTSNYTTVASEFRALSKGSWLLVAYLFGYCVASPVCGVLGDIFGRKRILLWSYGFFTIGCTACGFSVTMDQLILSRALTGLGGAGMVSLVSVILTEMMPQEEVVMYRGYANMVNMAGRSLGALIGGILTQTVGWRWSFLGQIPIVLVAILITVQRMPTSLNIPRHSHGSTKSKLASIDFSGILLFTACVLMFLLAVQNFNIGSILQTRLFYVTGTLFLTLTATFFLLEVFWAKSPLIPFALLKTSFGAYCLSQFLITMGRSAFIPTTAPYFIRAHKVSDIGAAVVNLFAMAGVPLGGYLSGLLIRRTGQSKKIGIVAACSMCLVYLLILLRWQVGCSLWEASYLLPLGFTMGILFSTQYTGMTSVVPDHSLGQCIGTFGLFRQLGAIIGPLFGLKLIDHIFQESLRRYLIPSPEKSVIIRDILDDARYSFTLPQPVQYIVREAYLSAFKIVPIHCVLCVVFALPAMIFAREKSFSGTKL